MDDGMGCPLFLDDSNPIPYRIMPRSGVRSAMIVMDLLMTSVFKGVNLPYGDIGDG